MTNKLQAELDKSKIRWEHDLGTCTNRKVWSILCKQGRNHILF